MGSLLKSFKLMLVNIGHSNPYSFDVKNVLDFRRMVIWLEDEAIKRLDFKDRFPLRNIADEGVWNAAFFEYQTKLGSPAIASSPLHQLRWLIQLAAQLNPSEATDLESLMPPVPFKPSVPPVTKPPVSSPPVSTPPASTPPASTPPVSKPPASKSPVSTLPASKPPVSSKPPASKPPMSSKQPASSKQPVPPTIKQNRNHRKNKQNKLKKRLKQLVQNKTLLPVAIVNTEPMNAEQLKLVQAEICKMIRENGKGGTSPRFESATPHFGRLTVLCADGESAAWLVDGIPKSKPWPGARLSTRSGKHFPNTFLASAWFPTTPGTNKPESAQTVLETIDRQNNIGAAGWRILKVQMKNKQGQLIQFEMEENSFRALQNVNQSIFYNLGKIHLQSWKDPS